MAIFTGILQLLPFVMGPWADGVRFIGSDYRGRYFKHFRYTNGIAFNGSAAAASGVDAFMPIINDITGCQGEESWREQLASGGDKYTSHDASVRQVGNQIYVSYSTPVPFQGFTLSLRSESGRGDTSSFLVSASEYEGDDSLALPESDWTTVGMPTWSGKWSSWEARFAFSKENGNARVSIAQTPEPRVLYFYPGTQYLFRPIMQALTGIGCIFWAFFGFLKLAHWAWASLTVALFFAAIAQFGYAFERAHYRQSIALGIIEVCIAFLPIVGCFFQKYLIHTMVAFVFAAIVDSCIDLTRPYSLPGSNIDIGIHLKNMFEISFFLITTVIARYIAINRSTLLVANDKVRTKSAHYILNPIPRACATQLQEQLQHDVVMRSSK